MTAGAGLAATFPGLQWVCSSEPFCLQIFFKYDCICWNTSVISLRIAMKLYLDMHILSVGVHSFTGGSEVNGACSILHGMCSIVTVVTMITCIMVQITP